MSAEHIPDPVETVGHERRDVSVTAVTIFIISLEIFMLACCGLCLAFQKGYLHWIKVSEARIPTLSSFTEEPPAPRLQEDPTGDLQKYREVENALATSYGWADSHAGTVRMPIERAKALIASEGLPARAPESKP